MQPRAPIKLIRTSFARTVLANPYYHLHSFSNGIEVRGTLFVTRQPLKWKHRTVVTGKPV